MDALSIINRATRLIKPRLQPRGIEFKVLAPDGHSIELIATRRLGPATPMPVDVLPAGRDTPERYCEFKRVTLAEDVQLLTPEALAESFCEQAMKALEDLA